MSPLEKILDKAFTTLALDEKYVFWASMILRLKHKEVPLDTLVILLTRIL